MTCDTCRWFLEDSKPFGYCQRYPPTVQMISGVPISLRARVTERETCGEHQPKETV